MAYVNPYYAAHVGALQCSGSLPLLLQVDVGFPLVSDVATSLEEEGGDGALDGDNAFVQTADFLYLCRPTTRNAAIAEGKLSRHIKTLRSERVEPMAAFGVFDRHGLGFISRHDLKRALQVRAMCGVGSCNVGWRL